MVPENGVLTICYELHFIRYNSWWICTNGANTTTHTSERQ